ncbi:MAG: ABC transporter substrate-binding protein [Albimonas sp.]|uniref:ABC transporter substrate-binding protein n=1 Tax=Albimonas sp. TaxID=1872425 RepID=UPI004055F470|tara:strand:- start:798 stop:2060 length:1263 start_codon:yes stop_codon:yes gene_type:complete
MNKNQFLPPHRGPSRRTVLAGLGAGFAASLAGGRVKAGPGATYADDLWAKTVEELKSGSFRMDLNLHSWEGYTEEPVLDPFSTQTGANVNPQMLISDPSAVNNLRSGGTNTWDIINLNNAWQRKILYPNDLIVPLDKAKFEPLYAMNVPEFAWPYKWAMADDGALLGMIQRYGPSGVAINSSLIDAAEIEDGGYAALIDGHAGEYGILDYENWVIMHACMAAGFSPFRKHTEAEMAAYEEMIFKVMKNAKKISADAAALARDMITGEIVGCFPGSLYSVSAARMEGMSEITCVLPKEGIEETKTDADPMGKSGIIWIEVTSLVNHPEPTPLAEAFLIYCHTPEACHRVAAMAPGTLNPVVQMGDPAVLELFSQDELEAVMWGADGAELKTLVDRCIDFDINPDYDAMHDMYTEAKRSRGF